MARWRGSRLWARCAAFAAVGAVAAWTQGTGVLPLPLLTASGSGAVTVSWSTPAALNTQVWYGLHRGPLQQHFADWKLVTQHTATVSGLTAGTTYDLQVESSNYSNPDLWSPVTSFTAAGTVPAPPASAPAAGLPATQGTGTLPLPQVASPNPTTLTLAWGTGSRLNTQVWYALHGGGGAQHYANWTLVAAHSAEIDNLAAGASYDVRIESSNYNNPDLWSPLFTYTLSAPPPPAPQVTLTVATTAGSALTPLQTARLTAALGGDPLGVVWSATAGQVTGLDAGCTSGASCCPGGACAAIYSAPAAINADAAATITATSVSDPTQSASLQIQLAASSDWENLVAFDNGLHRGVAKPYTELARGGDAYQPDRMIFHETALGSDGQPINTEIWRLTNDSPVAVPDAADDVPEWGMAGVLNRTPWNQDGSYFLLAGNPCLPKVYCNPNYGSGQGADLHDDLFDAAGARFQLFLPTDANRPLTAQLGLSSGYLPWDKSNPNLLYVVTAGDTEAGPSETSSALYSVDVAHGAAMTKIVDLPARTDPVTHTPITKALPSYLAEDDVVMVQDVNPPPVAGTPGPTLCVAAPACPDYIPNLYFVDVNPDHAGTTYGAILAQYPIAFGLTLPPCLPGFNCNYSHAQANEYHLHDIYFQRDAGDHFIFNFGPKGDVGEYAFWQASLDGKTVAVAYPNPLLPGTPYLSHPAMNFDGSQVSYAGYDNLADAVAGTAAGAGTWVRTVDSIAGFNGGAAAGFLGAEATNHQGWDGYDPDYVIFDGYLSAPPPGCDSNNVGPNDCIAPYGQMSDSPNDPDGSHLRILVNDGLRDATKVGANQAPAMTDGPAQSPDATKILFVKPDDFANLNSSFNAYLAVDHRPLPPQLTSVAGGAGVRLAWTPYASHREVAGYHVYRSSDGQSWSEVTDPAQNTAAFGSIPATAFTDASAVAGAAYYYAVTAQEYSGLESSMLSNVMSTAGAAGTQAAAPGATGFDRTPPQPPTGLVVTKMASPGEWKLTWTASASPDVRYYNIYYSGGGAPDVSSPQAAQRYLIVSPAASESSYIYWEANPNDVPVFGMVAVDRQDNVSVPACVRSDLPAVACR